MPTNHNRSDFNNNLSKYRQERRERNKEIRDVLIIIVLIGFSSAEAYHLLMRLL